MDMKSLINKAKETITGRGGPQSVKEDAEELKDIAGGEGNLQDKAKAGYEAIKEPGAPGGGGGAPGSGGGAPGGGEGN
jgi:hypothetical protein